MTKSKYLLISILILLVCFQVKTIAITQNEEAFIGYPRRDISIPKHYTFSPDMFGAYTELLHGDYDKAKELKLLGLDYVILYTFQTDESYLKEISRDIYLLEECGIGVILLPKGDSDVVAKTATRFSNHKNLIGWYVYDEPTINGISREKQDSKIKALKEVCNLPCFTTECGYGKELSQNTLSTNYDYVFSDVYVSKARLKSDADLLKFYGLVGKLYAYGLDKVLPVYETYWETESFVGLKENLAKKSSLYGNDKGGVFFIYYTGETIPDARNIYNSNRLKNAVVNTIEAKNTYARRLSIKGFCLHDKEYKTLRKGVSLRSLKKKAPDGYEIDSASSIVFTFNKKVSAIRLYYCVESIERSKVSFYLNGRKVTFCNGDDYKEESIVIDNINSNKLIFSSDGKMKFTALIVVAITSKDVK